MSFGLTSLQHIFDLCERGGRGVPEGAASSVIMVRVLNGVELTKSVSQALLQATLRAGRSGNSSCRSIQKITTT